MRRLFCFLVLISYCSFTAEDPFSTLLKKLEEFTKRYPTEKVHLQLDKPYYAAGDNIWFKAYVADARTSQPSTESAILYVDLINELDSAQTKLRLPMENGITWGDFNLPDTLIEGNYRIRAYTHLMRNAGTEFFFDKSIKIGSKWTNRVFTTTTWANNTATVVFADSLNKGFPDRPVDFTIHSNGKTIKTSSKTDALGRLAIVLPAEVTTGKILASIDLGKGAKSLKIIPIISQSNKIDVQFFPESGVLLQGIASKIAIKAVNVNGKGKDVKGIIIDNNNEEVATFQTSHLGMGSFYFNPTAGKTFTAKMNLDDGTTYTVALPKAEASGYIMNVSQTDTTNIQAKITLSTDLLNKGDLNLIAHVNGMVYLSTKVSTAKQVTKINIPTAALLSGATQLTLFSAQDIPVAERMVFVNKAADKAAIDLIDLKANYGKREKVALELASGMEGSFSVAVTNTDVVGLDEANESNILSSMLLSSGLKGHVENPNYYFISNDADVREHLDNLMLTQGWTKIDWKTILTSELGSPKYSPEKSIRISGTITKDKKPLHNSKISLMSNKNGFFKIDTLSNADGKFAFEDLEFADATKFIIQARSELGKKNVDIEVDSDNGPRITPINYFRDAEVNVNKSIETYLSKSKPYFEEQNRQGLLSKTIQLKEVNIQGRAPNLAPNSLNLNGPGNADQVIDVSQLWMANSVGQYLRGRVSGVKINGGQAINMKTFKHSLSGDDGKGVVANDDLKSPTMHIILDGMDMGSTDAKEFDLNQLNPQAIESIEMLTSLSKLAVYGPNASRGLIIVTTKKGATTYTPVKYAPGVITYSPKGYYNARTFYSPMYDVTPSDKPDLRTTVFWKPNLIADENGKITFDYFNTDQPGNYRIVIEGFDIDGNLARKTYTYKVN